MSSSSLPPATPAVASPVRPPSIGAAPVADPPSTPGEREFHAFVGEGTAFSGRLSFAGRIRIEGQVEGEILGGELVVIAGAARIRGTIRARQVLVLSGDVQANITASDSIELCIPAVVHGDLEAPEVFLERGVSFVGKCTMGQLDSND